MNKEYLISFIVTFIGVLFSTPIIIRLARALHLVDVPDARKVHAVPTPRVGGLAIAASFFAVVLGIFLLDPFPHQVWLENILVMRPIMLGALGFLLVGLLDDIWTLRAQIKLLLLLGITVGVCWAGLRIETLDFGSWGKITLGIWGWPVTIFWILALTIAINFVDGLDGLAAGIGAISASTIAIMAILGNQGVVVIPALALAGGLTGFLLFNFHPARIFMGDSGSMFIGFLLATLSVASARMGSSSLGLLVTVLALSVPILDTTFTFFRRRVIERRSMFASERGHIHHHLLKMGFKQHHAVLVLYGISVITACSGLLFLFQDKPGYMLVVAFGLALPPVLLFKFTGFVNFEKILGAIRRNLLIGREENNYRGAFEQMQLRFAMVDSFEGWWKETCTAAEMMDVVRISLPLPARNGTTLVREWERTGYHGQETLHLVIPIQQRRIGGPVQAQVEVDASDTLEAAGRRLTFFARLMEEYGIAKLPENPRPTRALAPSEPVTGGKLNGNGPINGHRVAAARLPGVRVAVVHDFLYTYAGAERVLEQILQVFPHADLFSLFDFLPADQRGFIQNKKVQTSFINGLPFARRKHRAYLPLMPLAIEQLDVSRYDVVISSSYAVAKGIITRPGQLHVCYCHTPIRYAWDLQHQYLKEAGLTGIRSLLPRAILHYIRNWDARSAAGVDLFLTNSMFVGQRIQKFYRRSSRPVYPPVDTDMFTLETQKEDFYVTASRFVPYKRIDLIVEAFAKMPDRRLFVIGDGPMMDKVKAKAGPNTRILGYQSTERMRGYIQRARGFVFAAEEDFGIVPVEAQACGTPVIAYARGGTAETILEGVTGVFFQEQTAESIQDAVQRFESMNWDPHVIRKHAENFSSERFRVEFGDLVVRAWESYNHSRQMISDPLLRALDNNHGEAESRHVATNNLAGRGGHETPPDLYEMVANGALTALNEQESQVPGHRSASDAVHRLNEEAIRRAKADVR